MAEAYECDRCGGLNTESPDTLISVSDGVPRYGKQDRERREDIGASIDAGGEYYDICAGCRSDFEEWFENE